MSPERKIRRYSAYFRGWATAFGAHEKDGDEERGLFWLYGKDQMGLILTPAVKRFLFPLFLGRPRDVAPAVRIGAGLMRIDEVDIPLTDRDARAFDTMLALLRLAGDLHLYQTYHLVYPSGTRILTLSRRVPLALVYREIPPMGVELG
jgi:hypothetical protein